MMLKTPDHVAQSVAVTWNRSLIFLLMVLLRLLFKHRQLKTSRKVMTQEVKVPVAGLLEYSDAPYPNPVVQTEEKIVEVQQMQTIERTVEVLQIQGHEVIRHVTAPQSQEVTRQVSSPTVVLEVDECSDTRYGWNPSTMLPGTAFCRPISQTHASRSLTKDCLTGAQIQSTAGPRRQASRPVWSGRTVMSMTSGRTSAAC